MRHILHVDSRNLHFHKVFGSVSDFAPESTFGEGIPNDIEPVGSVACTALSGTKVGTSQTKQLYDWQDLWDHTKKALAGASPLDSLKAMKDYGLLRLGTTIRDSMWQSYLQVNSGPLDLFDNTRSGMTIASSSATVATNWYANWLHCPPGSVMPQGDYVVSGHDYVVKDWKQVNGVAMFVIDAHLGYDLLMPREVYNLEMGKLGCAAYIPTTTVIHDRVERSISEKIMDLMKNLILELQRQLLKLTPPQTVSEPHLPLDVTPPMELQLPQPETLKWDNPANVKHSCRVIMDDEGLTGKIDPITGHSVKDLLCAVIEGESGFNIHAINHNTNGSADYGLVQMNDHYWIGPGKYFESVDEVYAHPEKSVKFMIDAYKNKHLGWWYAYVNGSYKQFLK